MKGPFMLHTFFIHTDPGKNNVRHKKSSTNEPIELNQIAITRAFNSHTPNKYFKFALFVTSYCESKMCINCLKTKLT